MVVAKVVRLNARVPKIKFRKGGLAGGQTPAPVVQAASSGSPVAAPAPAVAAQQPVAAASAGPTSSRIEDDLTLPEHYQRRMMDQEEMDHVNSGGGKPYDPPPKPKKGKK